MCTFLFWMVHCRTWERCIVEFVLFTYIFQFLHKHDSNKPKQNKSTYRALNSWMNSRINNMHNYCAHIKLWCVIIHTCPKGENNSREYTNMILEPPALSRNVLLFIPHSSKHFEFKHRCDDKYLLGKQTTPHMAIFKGEVGGIRS